MEPNQASREYDAYLADNLEHVEMDMEKSDEEDDRNSYRSNGKNSDITTTSHANNYEDNNRSNNAECVDVTKIIQVTNLSPTVTLEQMTTLFDFIGDIVDIKLYSFENNLETSYKVCFVEFSQASSVLMAQHLTNTIFIDRALIVLPYNKLKIPDKETAVAEGSIGTEYVTNFNCGVVSQVTTTGGAQVITTTDPRLTALGLQTYPQLPINTDPTRMEEIRRTLYIGNLDSKASPDQVLKFFNDLGEVKYIRIAGDENQPSRFAFVEFTHQSSVANGLQQNGYVLGSRALKINHSNNPIVKPQPRVDIEDPKKAHRDSSLNSRIDYGMAAPRDRHHSYRDRNRERDRGRYHERRAPISPGRDGGKRSRRSRSRDRDSSYRSRRASSKSKERSSSRRRSRSKDRTSAVSRKRSRSGSRERSHRRSRSHSTERRSKRRRSHRR